MMNLLRDLVKEKVQQIFGEEMGGQGDPDPLTQGPYKGPYRRPL